MSKIKILQVEEPRNNAFCFADSAIPAGITVTKDPLVSMFPDASDHATEVAKRLLSHPENIIEIEIQHSGTYWGRGGIGIGRTNPPDVEIYPKPTHGQLVENHSYGMMDLNDMGPCLAKLDRRAERDNVVIVVAIPDSGMSRVASAYGPIEVRIPNCAQNIICVGSGRGFHEILPGGRVDIVTDQDWTSYGAPKVAEVAAAMVAEALAAGYAYTWYMIRNFLMIGADDLGFPNVYGAGRLNRDRTLSLWRQAIGVAPVVVPAPKIEPIPAPVVEAPVITTPEPAPAPVPVVTPEPVVIEPVVTPPAPIPEPAPVIVIPTLRAEKTSDQLCAEAAAEVGVQYDPGWHTFSNVSAGKVQQLADALRANGAI